MPQLWCDNALFQYLVLTLKVHEGEKDHEDKIEGKNSFSYFSNFILIISIYGLVMSILAFAPNYDATLKFNSHTIGWTDDTLIQIVFFGDFKNSTIEMQLISTYK